MLGISEPEGPNAYVFIDSKIYVNVRQNCTYRKFILLFVSGVFLPLQFPSHCRSLRRTWKWLLTEVDKVIYCYVACHIYLVACSYFTNFCQYFNLLCVYFLFAINHTVNNSIRLIPLGFYRLSPANPQWIAYVIIAQKSIILPIFMLTLNYILNINKCYLLNFTLKEVFCIIWSTLRR